MARKRWASKPQLNLLRSYIAAYNAAQKGTKKDLMRFWPILETAWFANFPLKDEMVADGQLPEVVLGSGYEWVKDSPEEVAYQKMLTRQKEQLKTLIRYESAQDAKRGSITNASRAAISTAAKSFIKAHRRCFQPQEMYYHLYKGEIEEMFEEEKVDYVEEEQTEAVRPEDQDIVGLAPEGDDEDHGEKMGKKRRRGWNLRLRRKIFSREWEAASPERQEHVRKELEKQRAQMALDISSEGSNTGLARDGKARLSSLQKILGFWASNAQMCWENAAVMSVQIGVAPDPSNRDQLVAMSLCYGLDQNGKVFQDVHAGFTETFTKPIVEWAQANVFTPAAWQKAKNAAAANVDTPAHASPQKPGDVKQSKGANSPSAGQEPPRSTSSSDDGSSAGGTGIKQSEDPTPERPGTIDDDLEGFSDDQGFDDIHELNLQDDDVRGGKDGKDQSEEERKEQDIGVEQASPTLVQPAPSIAAQETATEPSQTAPTMPRDPPLQTPKPAPPKPFDMPKMFSAFAGQSAQVPPPPPAYGPHSTPPSMIRPPPQLPASSNLCSPNSFASSVPLPFPLDPVLVGCVPSLPSSTSPHPPHQPHDYNQGPNEPMSEGLLRATQSQRSLPWPNMPPGYKFSFGRPSDKLQHPLEAPRSYFQFGDPPSATTAIPATPTQPPVEAARLSFGRPVQATTSTTPAPLAVAPPPPVSAPSPQATAPPMTSTLGGSSTISLTSAPAPSPSPAPWPVSTPSRAVEVEALSTGPLTGLSAQAPNPAPTRPRPRPTMSKQPHPASSEVAQPPVPDTHPSCTTAVGVGKPPTGVPPAPSAPSTQDTLENQTPASTRLEGNQDDSSTKTHKLTFESNVPAPPPPKPKSSAKQTRTKKTKKVSVGNTGSAGSSALEGKPEVIGPQGGTSEGETKKRKRSTAVTQEVEPPAPGAQVDEGGRGKRKRVPTKRFDEYTPLAERAKATDGK